MKVDDLSEYSRDFYERALFKRAASFMLAAVGMMFLGFCSEAGARAQYYNIASNAKGSTQDMKTIAYRKASGYGFACFCYIVAALLSIGIAIYVSPDVSSKNERDMWTDPHNLEEETSGAGIGENTGLNIADAQVATPDGDNEQERYKDI